MFSRKTRTNRAESSRRDRASSRGQNSLAWFSLLALAGMIILSAVGRWYQTSGHTRKKAARSSGKPLVAAPDMALPDFMEYCRLEAVPVWIQPLIDLRLAPSIAAKVDGWQRDLTVIERCDVPPSLTNALRAELTAFAAEHRLRMSSADAETGLA